MFMRIFVGLIILIAIAVGILAMFLPREQLLTLVTFRDFFDVTLPILAFGVLVKLLWSPWFRCDICGKKKHD
jgi:hypothetical protein